MSHNNILDNDDDDNGVYYVWSEPSSGNILNRDHNQENTYEYDHTNYYYNGDTEEYPYDSDEEFTFKYRSEEDDKIVETEDIEGLFNNLNIDSKSSSNVHNVHKSIDNTMENVMKSFDDLFLNFDVHGIINSDDYKKLIDLFVLFDKNDNEAAMKSLPFILNLEQRYYNTLINVSMNDPKINLYYEDYAKTYKNIIFLKNYILDNINNANIVDVLKSITSDLYLTMKNIIYQTYYYVLMLS